MSNKYQVKYHNDFEEGLVLKKFNTSDLNFLMTICSKMKDRDIEKVTLSFQELKKLSHWKMNDNKIFVETLKEMNRKLMSLNFEIKDKKKTVQFVLFPTFILDEEEKSLEVRINPDFKYLLNDINSNFTKFELENFTKLKSKYSKIFYKLVMKFKATGYLILSFEDFKKKLDIPDWYRVSEIDKNVIKHIIKELPDNFESFTLNKLKSGRSVDKIEVLFSLKKDEKKEKKEIVKENSSVEILEKIEEKNNELKIWFETRFKKINWEVIKVPLNKLADKRGVEFAKDYILETLELSNINGRVKNKEAYFVRMILENKRLTKGNVNLIFPKIEKLNEKDKKYLLEIVLEEVIKKEENISLKDITLYSPIIYPYLKKIIEIYKL